jgi:phosphoserine phosphatase
MTATRSPLRLSFVVLEKITRKHLLKYFAIRLLAGDTAQALNQSAVEYAALLLAEKRIPTVWKILENPLKYKKRIVLASASLEPIVAALAKYMGVHYIASKLEQKNGIYTGRYADDITGDKEVILRKKYNKLFPSDQLYVISDNFTDLSLLKKAKHAYVVLHKESHRQRWGSINATFLKVDE